MKGRKLPRTLVVIPTLNEAENLEAIVEAVLREAPSANVLIVDGASTDGTDSIADRFAAREPRVEVLHRPDSGGLGRAYVEGFRHALAGGFKAVVQMDADFSHPPEKIEALVEGLEHADVVVGSRYVRGASTIGWSRTRWCVSRLANLYARAVTGLPVADVTAGFRALSRKALEAIDLDRVRAVGYGFQVELSYLARRYGLRVIEIPIAFRERRAGTSKANLRIAIETLLLVPRLGWLHGERRTIGRGPGAVLALMVLAFVALKLYAVRPVIGDEGIYFYLGWRTGDGLIPYRDFIFVHPPMHIYIIGLLSALSGGMFAVVKGAPALMTLMTGLILFDVGRMKPFARFLPGPWWPLLPPLFFLFCYDVLRVSSHYTGVNQATFFLIAGLWLFLRGRPWLAGACYAAALATATYVLPILVMLFVLFPFRGAWRDRDERQLSRRTLVAALVVFVLIHLPAWLLAPSQWWEQTVLFQLGKPATGSTFAAAFRQMMSAEGFLAGTSLLFTLSCLRRSHRERIVWLPLIGLIYIALFLLLGRVYIYYLVAALPFLALGGGLFLRNAWASATTRRGPGRFAMPALVVLALLIQPLVYRSIPDVARDPGRVMEYTFSPTPGLGPVNTALSAIFPKRRIVGIPAPGTIRYLWHENGWWEDAREVAAAIDGALPPGGTLYGDSTTTPLLAFLAKRRIACELADTNTLHFRAGHRSVEEDAACAEGDGLALVVRQPGRGIDNLPEFKTLVDSKTLRWSQSLAGKRLIELLLWQADRSEPY